MARGRAAGFEAQQEAILDHAARLFAARGFQGTSMQDLAAAAGVSKALLYHYYTDKYQLLVAIAEGHIDRLVAVVAGIGQRSSRSTLTTLLEGFLAEYTSARAHHQVLVQDIKYLAATDEQRIRDKERHVVQVFAQAIAALYPGIARARLEKPLTMLLFGMINWLFTWFREEGELDYAALTNLVTQFVTGGLAAVERDSG